ncbi:hypothetical protein HaLaN_04851 [Haematococcus lacustris]|uniref:Uncharacterized protein n=1 Tax=Haematococcus lacustris TaxID=44745 RepID=A0A699YPG6_HAELA|nr:hypothetical protein HaLaN_04851 [Haematococcus lacustris]
MALAAVMTAVPYHQLHHHRPQVLRAVQLALDDDVRAVRQMAVNAGWH